MKRITPDEIAKWRVEISNSEKFRDDNLGKCYYNDISKSGENIDYFETGLSGRMIQDYGLTEPYTTVNIIFPIVKNVIPTLYWKNPYINVTPKRSKDQDSAPYAGKLINAYYDELDVKSVNRDVIFDAYVIGMGVCKIGYSTKFGTDIPDDNIEKDREKEKKRGLLEVLGLKKPKQEEEKKENIELNEFIKTEKPYVVWVSPFNFGIDPAAKSIYDARFVYEKTTQILDSVKKNKAYSNTKNLEGTPISESLVKDVPETQIDNFKLIDLYEIHYKTEDGINILILAKDGERTEALYHDESIYDMDGFQYEILAFNKHNHKLYPRSDIDIVKGLQDRIAVTFDNIIEQIDKYVPKIFVDETGITVEGKKALIEGGIGAHIYTNKNPNEVVKEASFTQLKGDLAIFIDKLMDIIMLETGLTKAQLMGMTQAQTATEAQIGQSGQNLRMSDKFDLVGDFANRQAKKLWSVIQQFVDLEEVELITGEQGIDEITGMPKFNWMPQITGEMSESLSDGQYNFKIDVTSIEKPDLPVLRQQVERLLQLVAQPGVLMAYQTQGYKIELAELGKRYLQLFPYVFPDIGKVIHPITQQTQGLMPPPMQPQGQGQGGPNNPANQPKSSQPPNIADILSGQGGEKGSGGFPLA